MKKQVFLADSGVVDDIQTGCFGVLADLIKFTAVATALLLLALNLR